MKYDLYFIKSVYWLIITSYKKYEKFEYLNNGSKLFLQYMIY